MRALREAIRDPRVAAAVWVVAAALVGYRLWSWRAGGNSPPRAVSPLGAAAEQAPPAGEGAEAAQPLGAAAPAVRWNWDRNPFLSGRPADAGEEIAQNASVARLGARGRDFPHRLRGTVISGPLSVAVFGNKLVPAGEQIEGWTVTQIESYRVTLRKGGEERIVDLLKPVAGGAPVREGESR